MKKRNPAWLWLIANSFSIVGRSGERITRAVKLIKKRPVRKKIGANCELNDAVSGSVRIMLKRSSNCFSWRLGLMYGSVREIESKIFTMPRRRSQLKIAFEVRMHLNKLQSLILFALIVLFPADGFSASSTIPMRLLYPSFAGSWATAWIAKEAGYFTEEGLDVELIRVGGSTRMVAAMLGGSAPIIQAGASAAIAATGAGSEVVIIAATGRVSPFRLMARPEIKQPLDLKGKRAGITTFGSTSDQVVRIALKHFGLEPKRCSDSYVRRAA